MSSDESSVDTLEPVEEPAETGPERPQPRWLLLGSAAFALAALLAAAVFGVLWWVHSSGDDADLATAREEVVTAGRAAIKAYTEVDFENLDAFFAKQKDLSDQGMKEQLAKSEPTYRKALAEAKTKVTTTVQDIGVEELDNHQGKAKFLAAVTLEVKQGDKTVPKAIRIEVQMTRDPADNAWKLSGIGDVPLVAAGQ
ncbi:Mce-associated membrane protein [Amycolatopsis xylanica]|uniref:Mce-associated membrane protein n=1 Tax=Amycolatopsis xylanica TaxID=589385 RepID=A0A1H3LGC0_9PSEU|nr:hypothetical protein [Amycolatopsis xylanica]SDY62915.1 Mce-associated membrane protein [Amycolatopsis xylanica]